MYLVPLLLPHDALIQMVTYALLGATGSTGSAILRVLLEEPPPGLKLKIFVRSKSKLSKSFPRLEDQTPFPIEIIQGTPDDAAALQTCLRGANVVFMCIATNQSTRTNSICFDVTTAIVAALTHLRQEQGYTIPTILQLRSVNSNALITSKMSPIAVSVVRFCLYYVYSDLERGCDLLEKTGREDPALLNYIFVDPPGLHDSTGTARTGHQLMLTEPPKMHLNYSDLGAGFCEVAERRNEFSGKAVAVSATGAVNMTMSVLVGYIATGLKARWIG